MELAPGARASHAIEARLVAVHVLGHRLVLDVHEPPVVEPRQRGVGIRGRVGVLEAHLHAVEPMGEGAARGALLAGPLEARPAGAFEIVGPVLRSQRALIGEPLLLRAVEQVERAHARLHGPQRQRGARGHAAATEPGQRREEERPVRGPIAADRAVGRRHHLEVEGVRHRRPEAMRVGAHAAR